MKPLRPIILFVLLVGGYTAIDAVLYRRVVPGDRVTTLHEFLEWQPAADDFVAVNANGERHVIAYGHAGGLLPSGPAAYVFDPAGNLVDWSPDIGDDSKFDDKWQAQRSRGDRVLSRLEVEKFAAPRPGN